MTALLETPVRLATTRTYLMCRPEHFEVSYAINPWMDPTAPVDTALAVTQWEALAATYRALGHTVETIEPEPGLPDMVFAANGGLVVGGRAYTASFANAERQAEGPAYAARLRTLVGDVVEAKHVNEGEGDFLAVGNLILAGTGFRTDHGAHAEAQEVFGRPVVTLQLVDPRFYHLDTAIGVLDDETIAYYPKAFSAGSRGVIRTLFPEAIEASAADASVLGLNLVSDGRNVVISDRALGLQQQLRERGYDVVPVDLSELLKSGGSVKCCTLELRGV